MTTDDAESPIDLALEEDFCLGEALVRPSTLEVVAGDRREVLQPRIMQVLVLLARRRGQVVSHDELIARCWRGRFVGEDAIHRCISAIRRLADLTGGFAVETIATVGYRLTEVAPALVADRRADFLARRRVPAWVLVVCGLVLLVLVATGIWMARNGPADAGPASARVAVLPFDTLSQGPIEQAFATGLLDEILGVLATNQVLAVSRSESQALQGPDGRAAISRLRVSMLLGGTVQSDGRTMRIRVHLDDTHEHVILWSKIIEGPADDPDALQAQVAARVTELVTIALEARSEERGRIDAATLSSFIEANDLMMGFGDHSPTPILRQVVERAPGFSSGHEFLAATLGGSEETRVEALRALEIDPKNGGAYLQLQSTKSFSDWSAREALLLKAFAVEPANPYVSYIHSVFLSQVGRNAEALEAAQRAAAIRPTVATINANLAVRLAVTGQAKPGALVAARVARLWPDHGRVRWTQFHVALQTADYSRAISLMDNPRTNPFADLPASVAETWRLVLRALEKPGGKARENAVQTLKAAVQADQFDDRDAVIVLCLLSDVDGALSVADGAYSVEKLRKKALGTNPNLSYLFSPAARPMRNDVRFMALASRMGLVKYWSSTGKWPDFCGQPGLPYDCRLEAARQRGPHGPV